MTKFPSYSFGTKFSLSSGEEITAQEIYLVESNDAELYRQMVEPTIKNYARKKIAGTYDAEKAVQGIQNNLVREALRRYKKEQGDIGKVNADTKRRIAELWFPEIDEAANDEVEQRLHK